LYLLFIQDPSTNPKEIGVRIPGFIRVFRGSFMDFKLQHERELVKWGIRFDEDHVLPNDDGRSATMSWLRHDVGSAHTSSGLRPDDGRFATTSWLRHDQIDTLITFGGLPIDFKLQTAICGWSNRIIELFGRSSVRRYMVQMQSDLVRELHTTVSILVFCPNCDKRVTSTYKPEGTGSKLHCNECKQYWCS
jgi:hypothetical protein